LRKKNIMHNSFNTKLKEATNSVRMTSAESARMREILSEYQSFNPIRKSIVRKSTSIFYNISHYHKRALTVSLVLLLILSGGSVSYGAESAIPGDTLYSLKVNVNEEIWSALAFSNEMKAEWETERAERRLEEATSLVALGDIREEIVTQIAENFEAHAIRVEDSVEKLALKAPQRAKELRDNFEIAVLAHVMVLRRFGENTLGILPASSVDSEDHISISSDDGSEVKNPMFMLVTRVEERGRLTSQNNILLLEGNAVVDNNSDTALQEKRDTENSMIVTTAHSTTTAQPNDSIYSGDKNDALKSISIRFGKKAGAEIERVKSIFPKAKDKLTSKEVEQAEIYIEGIDLLYSEATNATNKGDYERALKFYQRAFPHAVRLRVWLSAGVMFEVPAAEEFEGEIKEVDSTIQAGTSIPIPYSISGEGHNKIDVAAFKLTRTYTNGVHKFSGTVTTPTPCYTVSTEYTVAESHPEQISLYITTKATDSICVQTIGEKAFSADVRGVSKDARLVGIFVNGEKIDIEFEGGGEIWIDSKADRGSGSSIQIEGEGGNINIWQNSDVNESSASVHNSINVRVNTGSNSTNGADGQDGENGADGQDGAHGGTINVGAGSVNIQIDTQL
jgi:hypothetical protein